MAPPLSHDPERLKIPAFMRKREILSTASAKRKLEMTALDRKEKGILPIGVTKKIALSKKPTLMEQKSSRTRTTTTSTRRPGNMWEIAVAQIHREKHPEARVIPQLQRRTTVQKKTENLPFEAPISPYYKPDRETRLRHDNHYAPAQQGPVTQALKAIGEVTQFFGKINVAVLRLDDELCVGDTITYQTVDGSHTQTVLSMEIDRRPIFKAGTGDEIGIKLYKPALVGKVVYAAR